MAARCFRAGPWVAVRGGGAGVIARCAIITAIFLATNAGAAEIDSPRHLFPLRRTDHTKLYPKASVITTVRDQTVLTRASEGQFSGYYRYLATRSHRDNRLEMHNRSAGLTSISTDQPRVSKFRAQFPKRAARRSWPPIRTPSQTQASKPAAPATSPTDRADRPTSQAGIFSAQQAASTTTVTESNHDEHGSAFALSPAPLLAERPSPPAELQEQSQQEKAQQTPLAETGKEEPRPHAETGKSQESAALVDGVLGVPGAATDTDTVPSKFSEKNAADDKLVTFAYTFKLLSREERSAIYQALKGQPGGRVLKADIGTKLPLGIELRAVPDELIVRVPQTRGYDYTVAGNEVLLVSPLTRVVVGVFSDRD
jgi:hypothetical protein